MRYGKIYSLLFKLCTFSVQFPSGLAAILPGMPSMTQWLGCTFIK